MKTTLFRFGRTAACLTLAVALLTGCSLLPAASPRKDPIPVEQPSDASAALDDGKLRILYDSNGSTVLCGSKVLHEGRGDETVALVYDPAESDIPYYWVAWSDNSSPSGRRSALYDKTGAEVLPFEQDHSVTLSGNYLVLNQTDALEFSCDHAVQPGDCRVIDLTTRQEIPSPDTAYQCVVSNDLFAFTCYERSETLADGEYDEDMYQHVRMVLQDREGNPLREEDRCTATSLSNQNNTSGIPSDWILLDFYMDGYLSQSSTLSNTVTGEELDGFDRVCGNGTASFRTEDGQYQLIDLASTEQSEVLATFDRSVLYHAPGAVVCWNAGNDYRYQFHDLTTGEMKPVYNVDADDKTLAVYATDGTLRVYDRTTGAILTDVNVDSVENQDSARVWAVGEDYALVMLYPAGDHSKPTIRLYDAQGLVRQLTISASTPDGYYYFAPLTTTDGHAYFRYGYAGPNGKTLYDVLDENGNAVLKGLALCYSYYGGNGLNDLPAGAFMARKGFYYGWMTPDGQWLYCRSIFASSTDEHGYGDLI